MPSRRAPLVLLLSVAVVRSGEGHRPEAVRYELPRATVLFERGSLSGEQMERFAGLVEKGIADIETYLGGAPERRARIVYRVSSTVRMSRAYRRTVLLPMERVQADSAPYLHETTHVLLPTRCDCLWLGEGFASYVQSYVSENLGGYDGAVFSRGGNRQVDRYARRHLGRESGRAVLPYVGGSGSPPRIESERRRVAAPFYVLSHSFAKFLVARAGLAAVRDAHRARDAPAAIERATGVTVDRLKAEWLASLGHADAARAATRGGPAPAP